MRNRNHVFPFQNTKHGIPNPTPRVSNVNGVFSHFNPTRAIFRTFETEQFSETCAGSNDDDHESEQSSPNGRGGRSLKRRLKPEQTPCRKLAYVWNSRNNRKGRHVLAISSKSHFKGVIPDEYLYGTNRFLANVVRLFTSFPYYDSAYMLALVFIIGSVAWIANGVLTLLTTLRNPKVPTNLGSLGGEYVALIATVVFVVANVIQMLEKLNEHRSQCFGWSSDYNEDPETGPRLRLTPSGCEHPHTNKENFFESTDPEAQGNEGNIHIDDPQLQKQSSSNTDQTHNYSTFDERTTWDSSERLAATQTADSNKTPGPDRQDHSTQSQNWSWYPTKRDFWLYYKHDISFWACSMQLLGSVLGMFGSIMRVPGIYNHLPTAVSIAFVWVPKTVSGIDFTIAGILFMFETQTQWYIPALTVLGWHAGFLLVIGGVGFTLGSLWGVLSATYWSYQSSVATAWGAMAFLLSSLVQLYEATDKYSVRQEDFDEEEREDKPEMTNAGPNITGEED